MNCYTVLFEGTVRDSWKSHVTDPASEVIEVEYPLSPIPVYETFCNEFDRTEERIVGMSDTGWIQIKIPEYRGLVKGDKIQIIKL